MSIKRDLNHQRKISSLRRIKLRVKVGDMVLVISGDSRGHKGIIKKVIKKDYSVIVDGANIAKKAIRINQDNQENFISVEKPIHISNIKLV